jgi:hypothetical protein
VFQQLFQSLASSSETPATVHKPTESSWLACDKLKNFYKFLKTTMPICKQTMQECSKVNGGLRQKHKTELGMLPIRNKTTNELAAQDVLIIHDARLMKSIALAHRMDSLESLSNERGHGGNRIDTERDIWKSIDRETKR